MPSEAEDGSVVLGYLPGESNATQIKCMRCGEYDCSGHRRRSELTPKHGPTDNCPTEMHPVKVHG